ncbi:MAG: hypothetical protein ACI8XY_000537 [bacterium]|jgi:hypothetical protein|tara:strand:- start:1669 stop:3630 length:1962 start_codon:yes stop_codon:yes gene_type:complete
MNNWVTYLISSLCLLIVFFGAPESYTNSTGAPAGSSGSFSDEQTTCESCHTASIDSFSLASQVSIYTELEGSDYYNLGQSYYFAITASSLGIYEFGFQACFENELGEKVGELLLADDIETQLLENGNYITHTILGTNASGVKTWVFNWVAPLTQKGAVTLHASVLFSDNNGTITGDQVIYTSQTFDEPNFGCTQISAFNYNPQSDIEDGSCLFSIESEALSLSFQSLDVVGVLGEELQIQINVHNNSIEDLVVHVSRSTISQYYPTNWFCWGACYIPAVSESVNDLGINAGGYIDDFSGHMLSYSSPGTYPIEYCFYSENAIEDSICATVNFTILGELLGCTDPNALNFNPVANADDGTCILFPIPIWDFVISYGYTHTVAINTNASILINESPITIGDWIGVFYESDSGFVCAGYTVWTGSNVNLIVHGFDPESGQGFPLSDEFSWQVWDASVGVSWPMIVEYSSLQTNQELFEINGFSSVISMVNVSPITEQEFELPNGWSLFSTYMSSPEMDIVNLFDPIVDDLIIVKNNTGEAYIVEYQFNAIGDNQPGQGYLIKTSSAVSFSVEGAYVKPELFPISLQEGWNMVGYLHPEPIHSDVIFQELLDQDLIQIVKDYQGNALIPDWGFNGLGMMNPGEGYQLKVFEESILQY